MKDPDKQRVKKHTIQIKVGTLVFVAVILLSATFYLLYRNLSSIVGSIRIDLTPELKLLNIREIASEIEHAGNSVRLYTITKNPSDIRPYYKFVSEIDGKISNLQEECSNDSILKAQADTIGLLIGQNISIWNRLLALYREDNVVEDLKQLSERLSETPPEPPRQSLLGRMFRKSADSIPVQKEIAADLDSIVFMTQSARRQMAARESQLAVNSAEITSKFYDLITRMEAEVNSHVRAKAEAASEIAGQTYRWLVLAAISGGLLAILIIVIIIRYSRNAWAYQAALERSKDETIKLSKTRELFMANMSHEIRTPVTAISGFTNLLLQENSDPKITDPLKIIKSSSDHLLRIIDDILDFSKLRNDKLTLEKVDFTIETIFSDVYAMFENMASQNNTKMSYYLSPGLPPALVGDPYRLRQIIINLVSNAVKFTKNGSVYFAATSTDIADDKVELNLEVSDTGIGMDESKLNTVFDDFTQAEMNTTRKYGGTGLGLSIVKKLVELQKGTIDLTSKKNRGTTIICRIPMEKGDAKQIREEISRPLAVPEELKGMRILVVDDEEYNRLLFQKIFERWSFSCDLASSGMDALDLLKYKKYDLVFMDMLMPGIDGMKTVRFIRQEMNIDAVVMPVILVSAAPPGEDWEKFRNAGFNSFLMKPFTEELLLSAILPATIQNPPAADEASKKQDDEMKTDRKINPDNLYHISGGDNDFIRQMLESFIRTTGEGIVEIQEHAAKGDFRLMADIAHKLQPPCRHLGALELFDLLKQVEKIPGNGGQPLPESLIENMKIEYASVKQAVEDHIRKMDLQA